MSAAEEQEIRLVDLAVMIAAIGAGLAETQGRAVWPAYLEALEHALDSEAVS